MRARITIDAQPLSSSGIGMNYHRVIEVTLPRCQARLGEETLAEYLDILEANAATLAASMKKEPQPPVELQGGSRGNGDRLERVAKRLDERLDETERKVRRIERYIHGHEQRWGSR